MTIVTACTFGFRAVNRQAFTLTTALLIASSLSAQTGSNFASLEIEIKADRSFAAENRSDVSDTKTPLENVFVYVPRRQRAQRTRFLSPQVRTGLLEWMDQTKHRANRKPKTLQFQVEDKKLVPAAQRAQTGDQLRLMLNDDEALVYEGFANHIVSGGVHNVILPLKEAEPAPIQVYDAAQRYEPAWLLVLDHDLARVTDKNGVAVFEELPIGIDVPIFISYPPFYGRDDVKLVSETIQLIGRRFVFYSETGEPQEHKMTFVQDGP